MTATTTELESAADEREMEQRAMLSAQQREVSFKDAMITLLQLSAGMAQLVYPGLMALSRHALCLAGRDRITYCFKHRHSGSHGVSATRCVQVTGLGVR